MPQASEPELQHPNYYMYDDNRSSSNTLDCFRGYCTTKLYLDCIDDLNYRLSLPYATIASQVYGFASKLQVKPHKTCYALKQRKHSFCLYLSERSACAGAGLNIVVIPAARPRFNASRVASGRTSHWH